MPNPSKKKAPNHSQQASELDVGSVISIMFARRYLGVALLAASLAIGLATLATTSLKQSSVAIEYSDEVHFQISKRWADSFNSSSWQSLSKHKFLAVDFPTKQFFHQALTQALKEEANKSPEISANCDDKKCSLRIITNPDEDDRGLQQRILFQANKSVELAIVDNLSSRLEEANVEWVRTHTALNDYYEYYELAMAEFIAMREVSDETFGDAATFKLAADNIAAQRPLHPITPNWLEAISITNLMFLNKDQLQAVLAILEERRSRDLSILKGPDGSITPDFFDKSIDELKHFDFGNHTLTETNYTKLEYHPIGYRLLIPFALMAVLLTFFIGVVTQKRTKARTTDS